MRRSGTRPAEWVDENHDDSQHVLVLAAPEYADYVTTRLANPDMLDADVFGEDG